MRRRQLNPLFLGLTIAALTSACSGDKNDDDGTQVERDGGTRDSGAEPPPRDAGPRDAGFEPCLFDQGGIENRGCDPGFVCNLRIDPPACVPGKDCVSDADCDSCSALNPGQREDCGHGFTLTAWCDTNHGNVCTRSRAPCEPCETDTECGRRDPVYGGGPNSCVEFEAGGPKFCTRPGPDCPDGFVQDPGTNLCVRSVGCAELPSVCPAHPDPTVNCGNGQICPGEDCGGLGEGKCATNNQVGVLGTCIGFCTSNADCPPSLPICNTANGLCIPGCTPGSCPDTQVCHLDGFCAPRCDADEACETNDRYGPNTYCNLISPPRPEPRRYKSYRDEGSCAPLGCERSREDCWGQTKERVCDTTQAPPRCVDGCYIGDEDPDNSDCRSGRVCKSGPQGQYTREQCRALADKTNADEIGVCCDPGCRDRNLQCPGIGKFCCAEPDSPYEDPATCLTLTATDAVQAQPGQCFDHGAPAPWCAACPMMGECDSGWTPGFNTDPNINGGMPFQEQEICLEVGSMMAGSIPICGVTCNPQAEDTGCPSRWSCNAFRPGCLQDADCGPGLECINEDTTSDPPREGQCKCGEDLVQTVACPNQYAGFLNGATIANPRCQPFGEEMVCVAMYNCQPPGVIDDEGPPTYQYPVTCEFP